MKIMKNKIVKSLSIIAIILSIITTIAIAAKSDSKRFNSVDELKKDANTKIGDVIYLDGNTFRGRDDYFCFEHKSKFESGDYKIEDIIDIDGKDATNVATKKEVKGKYENLIMSYILFKGNYSKQMFKEGDNPNNLMSGRNIAIWAEQYNWINSLGLDFFSKNWSNSGGWRHDYNREDIDKNFPLQDSAEREKAKNLIKEAKEYADKYIGKASIKITGRTNVNAISDDMFGPFGIRYSGEKLSLKVINNDDKDITNKVKIYSDSEGKKQISISEIKSNTKFYIKGTDLKKVTVSINSEHIKVRMYLLSKENFKNGFGQNMLIINPETNPDTAEVEFNVNSKGTLRIKKIDADDPDKVLSAGFKIYREGKGYLYGTSNGYSYYQRPENASTYHTDRFKDENGYLKLEGLDLGKYKVYEVEAPSGYELKEQPGYVAANNWVPFGEEQEIGAKTKNDVTVTIKNNKEQQDISIKGYVWIDVQRTKANNTNSLWDNDETKVAGVTVNLVNKSSKKIIATTKTDANGEYVFDKILKTGQLKDHYVEFKYNGVQVSNQDISKYIPVAFNSTNVNDIKPNGSRAIMNEVAQRDTDLSGIATTYKGTQKENIYGLGYNGNLYKKLISKDGTVLENINLGLKKIPEPQYNIKENLSYVKIGIKGYEYTYIYGGTGNTSRVAAPRVNWQNSDSIYAYSRDIYPSDIAYDVKNSTEELKVDVTYRIDITNITNHNIEELYKDDELFITNLTNTFDTNRYKLNDKKWTESNGTATITDNYKRQIFSNGIKSNNTATSYITFSVKHDALVDILNHPRGIIEKNPTKVVATGYHQYTRKDYSWENDDPKEQTHITVYYKEEADAPYLIFKLGEERKISGRVFEDTVVTTDGRKLGNGEYDNKENVVKDVKVELLDVKENITDITQLPVSNIYGVEENEKRTAISKPAQVVTDKEGNYTLNGLVPGKYYLRFTYGDGTQKICDFEGNEIKDLNAKDYKSTIVTNKIAKQALKGGTDVEWYKKLNSSNSSIAIDNLNTRIGVNQGTLASIMAGTAQLDITIENTETKIANIEVTEGGQKALNSNKFEGMNLGIIEQPKQDAKFEKIITKIKLTNAQNNLVFEGNPEKDSMQGVTDLDKVNNGGSTYTRAELVDDMISGANLELTYGIKVTNISDVNYYNSTYYWYGDEDKNKEVTIDVNEILDYLDKTLQFNAESSDTRIKLATETENLNTENKEVYVIEGIEKLYTEKNKSRQNDNLKTSDTVTLVAGRPLSNKDDDMEFINEAEITKINNGKDSRDNTTDGDKEIQTIKPIENKYEAQARATVTPPTGENRQELIMYAVVGIFALAILSAGIVIIKKIVNK